MGACFSADTKVSGGSSSGGIVPTRLRPIGQPQKQQQPQPEQNNQAPREKQQQKDRGHKRRPCGLLSCGKRTDFGYAKDFESRYSIGKLLGHGQFGYTFVATENSTEERVAVKRIDKSKIDSNTDGLVDFTEFVAATLHVHQMEEHDSEKWHLRCKAAFDKFDVDGDGYITPEELRMHTGLRGSIEPLLEEADIDKDGKISLSEFRKLLRTASMSSNVPSPSGIRNPQKF